MDSKYNKYLNKKKRKRKRRYNLQCLWQTKWYVRNIRIENNERLS
jgi:hypothetical protein